MLTDNDRQKLQTAIKNVERDLNVKLMDIAEMYKGNECSYGLFCTQVLLESGIRIGSDRVMPDINHPGLKNKDVVDAMRDITPEFGVEPW